MSSFCCEHCGAVCMDSPRGYVNGCEHYPPDITEDKDGADDSQYSD